MKKKGFFITLLVSNFMILLVAVTAMAINYFGYKDDMVRYVNDYNIAFLNQIRDIMDERVSSANQLAINISKNSAVEKVEKPYDNYARVDAVNAMKALESYALVYGYLDSICVYYPAGDMMVTNESVYYSLDDFFKYSSRNYWSEEEWNSLIGEDSYFSYQSIHSKNVGNKNFFTIVYRPEKMEKQKYYIILNFNYSFLEKFGNQADLFKAGLLLAKNENGETMFTLGDTRYLTDSRYDGISRGLDGQQTAREFFVGKERIMATKIFSSDSQWTYYFVIPENLFVKHATNIFIFSIGVLLILIGLLLAVVLAKLNVIPVRNMLKKVYSMAGVEENMPRNGNEFEFIGRAMTKSVEEYRQLQGKMTSQIPVLQMHSVAELFSGNLKEEPGYLESIGIVFPHTCFCAAVFNLDFDLISESEGVSFLAARFQNVIRQCNDERYTVYTTDMDAGHTIAAVLNVDSQDGTELANLLYNRILSDFSTSHVVITAAVGIPVASEEQLPVSYASAVRVLQHRLLKTPGGMVYASGKEIYRNEYYYSLNLEEQLIQSVKSGKIDNVFSIIDSVIMENFIRNHISLEASKCLMFSMMGTAFRVIAGIGTKNAPLRQEEMYQKISSCTNLQEVEVTLRQMFTQLCEYVNFERKQKSAKIIDQVVAYIHEHYADSSMSLSTVSAEVGLNPTYLSGYYKEQTNENFQSYLNRVRLEASLPLLNNKGLGIGDIALKVGYSNSAVYIRNFKKMYGVTPGRYRETQKQ